MKPYEFRYYLQVEAEAGPLLILFVGIPASGKSTFYPRVLEDRPLDYVSLDGACEEGPSYWNMAGGKVYEFAHILRDASGGRIDVMDDETFSKWMDYHFATCERQDLIGASHHTLDILRKT